MDANLAIVPVDWQLELDQGFTEFYVDPTLSLSNHSTGNKKLNQGVTEFYVDANFAFVPINGQLELDQHITGFYVDANVAIGPINWQLE
jgi:hypothetical protein